MKTLTLLLAATGLGFALYRMGQQPPAAARAAAAPPRLGLDKLVLSNAGSGTDANADNEDLLATPSKLIG